MKGFDNPPSFINNVSSALKELKITQLCRQSQLPAPGALCSPPQQGHQGHVWVGPSSPPGPVTQRGKFIPYLSVHLPTAAICTATNSSCFCENKQIAVTLQTAGQASQRRGEEKALGLP